MEIWRLGLPKMAPVGPNFEQLMRCKEQWRVAAGGSGVVTPEQFMEVELWYEQWESPFCDKDFLVECWKDADGNVPYMEFLYNTCAEATTRDGLKKAFTLCGGCRTDNISVAALADVFSEEHGMAEEEHVLRRAAGSKTQLTLDQVLKAFKGGGVSLIAYRQRGLACFFDL